MSSLLNVPGQDVSSVWSESRLTQFPETISIHSQNYATVRQFPQNGHATREPSGGDESATRIPPPQQEEHHDAPSTPPPNVTVHPPEPAPSERQPSSDEGPIVNVSVLAAPPARPSPPPSPPTRAVPPPAPQVVVQDPNPELVKKLEEAQAEIERLRQLIASMPEPSVAPTSLTGGTELRQRRRGPASDDGSSYDGRTYDDRSTYDGRTEVGSYVGSDIAPPEGVPLQVVIIIALGVFVTTYLFF